MAEDFQALLERINDEGLKAASAQSERIISEAEAKAARITTAAQEKAEEIIRDAERQAELTREKGEQSLKQASRAVLLDLRQTLEARVTETVGSLMKETMNTDGLSGIIAALCQSYLASNGNQDNLRILLDASQFAVLEGAVRAKLAENLKSRVEFSPSETVRGGFKLSFRGSDVVYDFTDDALAEAIADHLSAGIAAIIAQ